MREILKNKTLVLSVSGIIIAALALCTVMVAKATMADTENYIGKEKAKELALADAGVKITDATFTKSKLDKEDAVIVYEIEFYTNTAEYDYEIEATAGTIFSKEIEKIKKAKIETNNTADDNKTNSSGSYNSGENKNISNYIGVDKAKSIALSSAGISGVTFTKAKLDYDDGIAVYEIEFYKNGTEYEYEISATTGKVLSKDIDYDDDDDDDDNDDDYDNDDEDDDNDDEDHD